MCTKRSLHRAVSPTPNIHKALFTIPVVNRKSSSPNLSIKRPSLDDDVENIRTLASRVDKENFPLPLHKKSVKLTPTFEGQNVPKKNSQNGRTPLLPIHTNVFRFSGSQIENSPLKNRNEIIPSIFVQGDDDAFKKLFSQLKRNKLID